MSVDAKVTQNDKIDMAAAVEQAFDTAVSTIANAKAKNEEGLVNLEAGFVAVAEQIRKKHGMGLDIYRYDGIETSSNLTEDGSYHMTQSYVLALSKDSNDYYDHVLFVRHSSGHLNNPDFSSRHTAKHLGKMGREYQSIGVFDYFDLDPNKTGLRFNYPKIENIFQRFRGDTSRTGATTFRGSFDDMGVAPQEVATTLARYYSEIIQSDVDARLFFSAQNLPEKVATIMEEHGGKIAGRFGGAWRPSFVRVQRNYVDEVKKVASSGWRNLFGLGS